MAANLNVPNRRKSRASHQRTATRFCDEANISENDQLDLAEFIVAAHYLGAANVQDTQLMDIFMRMEDSDEHQGKKPKEIIKTLMTEVEEKYGNNLLALDEAKEVDDDAEFDENEHEIVGKTLGDAVLAEDAQWQEIQIDGFLSAAAQHQNLQIAKKLLQDTALTKSDIAQITGINENLLDDYEEDDEEYETDEDDDFEESKTVDNSKPKSSNADDTTDTTTSEAVVIKSEEFGKQIALTNGDLTTLDELIRGGKDEISSRSEEVLSLLKKLQSAVKLTPGGGRALKAQKTRRLDLLASSSVVNPDDKDKDTTSQPKDNETNNNTLMPKQPHLSSSPSAYELGTDYDISGLKLPQKFRVVIHPGALVKENIDLKSKEVAKVPIGTVVMLEEIDGRRGRVSAPVPGWVSLHAKDGRTILQKENTSSKEMETAVHAQRARQTKILILKSITTLNDATVARILEKSDWNLRRAIEAFYMAKYKTQQFMAKKEEEARKAEEASGSPQDGNDKEPRRKSVAKNWWKSWKSFAHQNK